MPESRRDQTVRRDHLRAAVPTTRERRVAFDVVQRRVDRVLVGVAHRQVHARVAERPQDADGLRRREREIEPGDLAVRRVDELVRVGRVVRLEHRAQLCGVDVAVEAELLRRRQPTTGCFAGTGVVVLDPLRDLIDVVLLLAHRELADAQHDTRPLTVSLPGTCGATV